MAGNSRYDDLRREIEHLLVENEELKQTVRILRENQSMRDTLSSQFNVSLLPGQGAQGVASLSDDYYGFRDSLNRRDDIDSLTSTAIPEISFPSTVNLEECDSVFVPVKEYSIRIPYPTTVKRRDPILSHRTTPSPSPPGAAAPLDDYYGYQGTFPRLSDGYRRTPTPSPQYSYPSPGDQYALALGTPQGTPQSGSLPGSAGSPAGSPGLPGQYFVFPDVSPRGSDADSAMTSPDLQISSLNSMDEYAWALAQGALQSGSLPRSAGSPAGSAGLSDLYFGFQGGSPRGSDADSAMTTPNLQISAPTSMDQYALALAQGGPQSGSLPSSAGSPVGAAGLSDLYFGVPGASSRGSDADSTMATPNLQISAPTSMDQYAMALAQGPRQGGSLPSSVGSPVGVAGLSDLYFQRPNIEMSSAPSTGDQSGFSLGLGTPQSPTGGAPVPDYLAFRGAINRRSDVDLMTSTPTSYLLPPLDYYDSVYHRGTADSVFVPRSAGSPGGAAGLSDLYFQRGFRGRDDVNLMTATPSVRGSAPSSPDRYDSVFLHDSASLPRSTGRQTGSNLLSDKYFCLQGAANPYELLQPDVQGVPITRPKPPRPREDMWLWRGYSKVNFPSNVFNYSPDRIDWNFPSPNFPPVTKQPVLFPMQLPPLGPVTPDYPPRRLPPMTLDRGPYFSYHLPSDQRGLPPLSRCTTLPAPGAGQWQAPSPRPRTGPAAFSTRKVFNFPPSYLQSPGSPAVPALPPSPVGERSVPPQTPGGPFFQPSSPVEGAHAPPGPQIQEVPPKAPEGTPKERRGADRHAMSMTMSSGKPSKDPKQVTMERVIGEIAFQLDRRILSTIFPDRVRLYGYNVRDIPEKIAEETMSEEQRTSLLERYESLMNRLKALGYDPVSHPSFTEYIVNTYGILRVRPDSSGLEGDVYNIDFLRNIIQNIVPEDQRPTCLILLECLHQLSKDDGKPLFIW